jgi:hypothetical protein
MVTYIMSGGREIGTLTPRWRQMGRVPLPCVGNAINGRSDVNYQRPCVGWPSWTAKHVDGRQCRFFGVPNLSRMAVLDGATWSYQGPWSDQFSHCRVFFFSQLMVFPLIHWVKKKAKKKRKQKRKESKKGKTSQNGNSSVPVAKTHFVASVTDL